MVSISAVGCTRIALTIADFDPDKDPINISFMDSSDIRKYVTLLSFQGKKSHIGNKSLKKLDIYVPSRLLVTNILTNSPFYQKFVRESTDAIISEFGGNAFQKLESTVLESNINQSFLFLQ